MKEQTDYKQRLQLVRKKIKNQLASISTDYEDGGVEVIDHMLSEFVAVGTNVEQSLCALADDKLITVCNVRFKKGGYIGPHRHDRVEHLYVLQGTIYDPVNDVTVKSGSVYTIEPNRLHAYQSDDALLTVTWQPAYPTRESQFN